MENGRSLRFCGSTAGPFNKVGGLFTVADLCDCQATRGHGSGPYPMMTRAEMRTGLDLLPTWALEHTAAANHQVVAIMRTRLAAEEQAARIYQEPARPLSDRSLTVPSVSYHRVHGIRRAPCRPHP